MHIYIVIMHMYTNTSCAHNAVFRYTTPYAVRLGYHVSPIPYHIPKTIHQTPCTMYYEP